MNFTPETAGTMAQILAVLLLATAFAPDVRGALARRTDRDYPSLRTYSPFFGTALTRYITSLIVLGTIALDAICILNQAPIGGWFGALIGYANAVTLGLLIVSTIYALFNHMKHDPKNATRDEPGDEHD